MITEVETCANRVHLAPVQSPSVTYQHSDCYRPDVIPAAQAFDAALTERRLVQQKPAVAVARCQDHFNGLTFPCYCKQAVCMATQYAPAPCKLTISSHLFARWRCCFGITISSYLFAREGGLWRGKNFLALPYYSQRLVFAYPLSIFFIILAVT